MEILGKLTLPAPPAHESNAQEPKYSMLADGSRGSSSSSDSLTRSNDNGERSATGFLDLPGPVMRQLANLLSEESSQDLIAFSGSCSAVRYDPSVHAASSAILARRLNERHGKSDAIDQIQYSFLEDRIQKCNRVDASMRKPVIIELVQISCARSVKHREIIQRLLWNLATQLQAEDRTETLQAFIESVRYLEGAPQVTWFDKYHEALKKTDTEAQHLLYASLAEVLLHLRAVDVESRFPKVFADISKLPRDKQTYALSHLSRSLGRLSDPLVTEFMPRLIEHVHVENDPESIGILLGMLHRARGFSDDQRNELLELADGAAQKITRPDLQLEYIRARTRYMADLPITQRLTELTRCIDIVEQIPKPLHFQTEDDECFWKYYLFAPLVQSMNEIMQCTDAELANEQILRLASHISCSDESGERGTFASLLRATNFKDKVYYELFDYCAEHERYAALQGLYFS